MSYFFTLLWAADAAWWVADPAGYANRAKWLGAAGLKKAGLKPRVLIVGIHDQILWPLDVETRSLLAQAKAMGFVETARFKMPTGGYVAMFQRAVNP